MQLSVEEKHVKLKDILKAHNTVVKEMKEVEMKLSNFNRSHFLLTAVRKIAYKHTITLFLFLIQ